MEHGQEVSKALRSNKTEQRCIQRAWQPAASASAGLGVCVCVVVGVPGRKRQRAKNEASEWGEHGTKEGLPRSRALRGRVPWSVTLRRGDCQSLVCACPGSRAGQSGAGVKPGKLWGDRRQGGWPFGPGNTSLNSPSLD